VIINNILLLLLLLLVRNCLFGLTDDFVFHVVEEEWYREN
jgi:hypothetical protein